MVLLKCLGLTNNNSAKSFISKVFSWIGNIERLIEQGFEIELNYENKKFTIIENEF